MGRKSTPTPKLEMIGCIVLVEVKDSGRVLRISRIHALLEKKEKRECYLPYRYTDNLDGLRGKCLIKSEGDDDFTRGT
jgi:hypothetical protein